VSVEEPIPEHAPGNLGLPAGVDGRGRVHSGYHPAQPSGAPEAPSDSDDLLPALQSTLAALAEIESRLVEIESRYELARECSTE
jgi:hypothetical protein